MTQNYIVDVTNEGLVRSVTQISFDDGVSTPGFRISTDIPVEQLFNSIFDSKGNFEYLGVRPPNYKIDPIARKFVPDVESALSGLRLLRNKKLSDSDWTQLPDVPLVTKEAWAAYRQALRDITLQPDPFNITWPTPPT